ncbi:uncharacterized protein [Solanum tuberosum]|uniref:uncharacterized protein n=1 Tax=Solanum tuberosum TaxID=4113 RepID=UPI00073A282C|nr:PREDICTED: uncharacterized protein LOC107059925 [Solanum tuberosum]
MSNISKVEFVALDISGKGYSSWILDAEIHLDEMGLVETIKDNNQASSQERAKAMIFLRHHLDEGLKMQYLTIKDPLVLWNNLKDRYDHLKLVILPQAHHDWFNLRIISQLNLCGEEVTEHDKLEKTYSTFSASSMLLQQKYREMSFKKYSELLSHLLIVERHNDLLIKNHGSRPVGSMPLPEVNQASLKNGDNNPEANFISEDNVEPIHKMNNNAEANFISEDNVEPMHLDVADFFVFPEGKMISDEPAII